VPVFLFGPAALSPERGEGVGQVGERRLAHRWLPGLVGDEELGWEFLRELCVGNVERELRQRRQRRRHRGALSSCIAGQTAGSVNFIFRNAAGSPLDNDTMSCAVFGDL
jgi:hypothetical protein